MKYTIKDITNGKIGVINDGTLSDLIKVLKEAFNMVDTPSFTGKYKYYFKSSLGDWWAGSNTPDFKYIPYYRSVKYFLGEINKSHHKVISSDDAQRIINIACNEWKLKLAKKWGENIALKTDILIFEEDYIVIVK